LNQVYKTKYLKIRPIKAMNSETKICLGAKRKVSPETIIMLKSDANYTNVYLTDGSCFMSSITLGILEKRLNSNRFIRPNRSALVNKQFIEKYCFNVYSDNGPSLRLFNKTVIRISRRKSQKLAEKLSLSDSGK
jgi:DNA-binding LytR/AlgR family response regulator